MKKKRSLINATIRRISAKKSSKQKQNKNSQKKDDNKNQKKYKRMRTNGANLQSTSTTINDHLINMAYVGSAMASEKSTTLINYMTDDPETFDYEILRNFNFPFENIVFEGGGIKGLSYAGALMVRTC